MSEKMKQMTAREYLDAENAAAVKSMRRYFPQFDHWPDETFRAFVDQACDAIPRDKHDDLTRHHQGRLITALFKGDQDTAVWLLQSHEDDGERTRANFEEFGHDYDAMLNKAREIVRSETH